MVERNLAKVEAMSSTLIFRSITKTALSKKCMAQPGTDSASNPEGCFRNGRWTIRLLVRSAAFHAAQAGFESLMVCHKTFDRWGNWITHLAVTQESLKNA